jgi:hypothetical protein
MNDGKIMNLIGKWLKAGVLEGENLHFPDCGSPQGGVISPLIANIFLHHVLDKWFVEQVAPRLKGRSFLVRFADDFILGCEDPDDADRVMNILPKRFGNFGLTIHPDKSKMIRFKQPSKFLEASGNGAFDFLGFTHYWGRSRNGFWVIKRQTMRKRQVRAMKNLYYYCRNNRYDPIAVQHAKLTQKLRGIYNYWYIL